MDVIGYPCPNFNWYILIKMDPGFLDAFSKQLNENNLSETSA